MAPWRSWVVVVLAAGCGSGASTVSGQHDAAVTPPADADPTGPDAPAFDAAGAVDAALSPDAFPSSGPFVLPFPATASCAPTGDACALGAPIATLHASYRKDFFYPYSQYPEASIPDPSGGGRVHVVATAQVTGRVSSIRVNGQDADALLDAKWLDWIHVWPRDVVAGQPVWIAFHSQSTELDAAATATVTITTPAGDAVAGAFPLAKPVVPITWVTTDDARMNLYVHVKNVASVPHTVSRLLVDGRDVTASACIAEPTLAPGQAAMFTVPRCTPAQAGQAWTAVVDVAGALSSAAGGRLITTHFPIQTWPSTSDCPFVGVKDDNYLQHLAHGFDTFFVQPGYLQSGNGCNVTGEQVVTEKLAQGMVFGMPVKTLGMTPGLGEASRVLARFLNDEADTERDTGKQREIAEKSLEYWNLQPAIGTYAGGSRHRHNGSFAGTADIQGMDFYVAACAPHITDFGNHPPLRGAYDYLRATRENHMPGATWLYTQGFSSAWNSTIPILDIEVKKQPAPDEARIQAFSVIAAGGKGLMYFQTRLEEALGEYAATWAEIGKLNRDIGAVRRFLREGDPTGQASASSPDVIVEAIRGPDAIVLVVVNVKNAGGMDDITCQIPGQKPHWIVSAHAPDVSFAVPVDVPLVDAFELRNGALLPLPAGAYHDGRTVTLPDVALDASLPTRLFVFAAKPGVRAEVEAGL